MAPGDKNDPASSGWVELQSGYAYTKSASIIRDTLIWLQGKRIFTTLCHKGYQSGGTIVTAVADRGIEIDRPRDWPTTHAVVRVIFRNSARLWSYFNGEVRSASRDTLYLNFPAELFVLQRRDHFRITLPEGSIATFLYNREKCKLNIQDLSAGGMLLITKATGELPQLHHTIKNICLTIPAEEGEAPPDNQVIRFTINQGEVVRSFDDRRVNLFYLGVKFAPSRPEEDSILKYIRQRELMLLRKGVLEE